jgi:hypothetical protein
MTFRSSSRTAAILTVVLLHACMPRTSGFSPRYLPAEQDTTLALFNACTSLGVEAVEYRWSWNTTVKRNSLPGVDSRTASAGANAIQILEIVTEADASTLASLNGPAKGSLADRAAGKEETKTMPIAVIRFWKCPADFPLLKEPPPGKHNSYSSSQRPASTIARAIAASAK